MKIISSTTKQFLLTSMAGAFLIDSVATAEQYPFEADNWEVTGQEFAYVDYGGQKALRLKGASATLKSVELEDGVLDFDIAVSEQRGFSGGKFRIQGAGDFEHFYIRPHQSGNPDANQYTPVFNGVSGWQLYYGDGYAAAADYNFDGWMHIRIVYQGSRAEIYVNSDEPTVLVRELKRAPQSGMVGLDASSLAEAYFANFSVSAIPDDYRFTDLPGETAASAATIMTWQVSDVFARAEIENMDSITESFKAARRWTRLQAESTGITNLARLGGIDEARNSAVGRIVIRSDSDQIKGLKFGYSDAVSVYVNGTRIYSGNNFYESRDYRYLGTIGLFDKVHLPLHAGENEVWFAVSEAFGGWGIQAEFDDLDGISIVGD